MFILSIKFKYAKGALLLYGCVNVQIDDRIQDGYIFVNDGGPFYAPNKAIYSFDRAIEIAKTKSTLRARCNSDTIIKFKEKLESYYEQDLT